MKKIISKIQAQFEAFLALLFLCKILRKNKNKVVVLFGGQGMGDMLIQSTYLDSWCRRNGRNHEDLLIVCHAPQEYMVHEMGYKQTLGISKKCLHRFENSYHRLIFRAYVPHPIKKGWFVITDPWFYMKWECQHIENLTALNVVRDAALKLYDYPCVQTFPPVKEDYTATAEKLGVKEPFVLVNAYSNTMDSDLRVFAMVAKALSQAGIHVYSNVVGNQEPVEGSIPLKCGVHEFYALSGGAEAVVSIRSGILDYCIANMKKLFCLYDGWRFYGFFTLRAWDTDTEIYEYRYEGEQDAKRIADEIVGKILEDFRKKNLPKG